MPFLFNRYRERNSGDSENGKAFALQPPLGDYPQGYYWRFRERMADFVGNRHGANDLYKTTQHIVVGAGQGLVSAYYRVEDWSVYDYWYDWDFPDVLGNAPTDNNTALEVLSKTNPSRAEVDLPVFLFELRDLPKMVRQVGDRIKTIQKLRDRGYSVDLLAEDTLALNFGWAPLMSDLGKMLDFVGRVDQRLQELDKLYSGNTGIQRQRDVYSGSTPLPSRGFYVGPAYQNQCVIEVDYVCSHKKWASVSWNPTSAPAYANHDQQLALARSLVWGHNITPSTVWEGMPWTWLTDWFSDVGDFLVAHRNTVPVESDDLCVMERIAIESIGFRFVENSYGARFRLDSHPLNELKMRSAIFGIPNPDVHLPFLSGKQLSNLTSLAILRFGK